MYKKTICIAFAACAIAAQAQTQGGGISPQMLQESRNSVEKSA